MSAPKSKVDKFKKVAQYSGMGIQMVVIILGFMWLGSWLDEGKEGALIWTLVFTLLGVVIALYLLMRSILKL